MQTIKKQYYGIKFPFTANNTEKFFLDLNENTEDKSISEILHTILTPKRTRLRMPEFGTDLARYIFSPNDDISWEQVKNEVFNAVKMWVPNTEIGSIEVIMQDDDEHKIYLALAYSVLKGNKIENNKAIVEI